MSETAGEAEPTRCCSNFTARSWSPTSAEPEDGHCVNCDRPEAVHSAGPGT